MRTKEEVKQEYANVMSILGENSLFKKKLEEQLKVINSNLEITYKKADELQQEFSQAEDDNIGLEDEKLA